MVNIPNIPGVTRLPLESFLVRTQLKPVKPLLWPSVKIYLPYVAATPFMLSPVLFPADPAAPGALPQSLQVLSLFCGRAEVGFKRFVNGLAGSFHF